MHCQYYALFQGLYLFPLYINIGICSSHLILVSSLCIREITIKFQRKCFKSKILGCMVFVGNLRLYIRILSIELILWEMEIVVRMTVLVLFRYPTVVMPVPLQIPHLYCSYLYVLYKYDIKNLECKKIYGYSNLLRGCLREEQTWGFVVRGFHEGLVWGFFVRGWAL